MYAYIRGDAERAKAKLDKRRSEWKDGDPEITEPAPELHELLPPSMLGPALWMQMAGGNYERFRRIRDVLDFADVWEEYVLSMAVAYSAR